MRHRTTGFRVAFAFIALSGGCLPLPPVELPDAASSATGGPVDPSRGADAAQPVPSDEPAGGNDMGSVPSTDAGGVTASSGMFTQPMPWTTDVSALPKSTESDTIINALSAAGGWGTGAFQTDISLTIQSTIASTPFRAFTATSEFYTPDCDKVSFPVPAGGALEGESGYACAADGDCHLIVIDAPSHKLYEMWRANIGATFSGGCAVVWDLTKAYDPNAMRGKGCTSADAAGLPIAAHLATSDEVFAGEVNHALRFILPNSRIQAGMYVAPATHTTKPTSGGASMPPYGVRFRLKESFNEASLSSQGAKVIARALKRYGMFLSDGGTVPLTVADDRFMKHKWSESGFDESALAALKVTDFEVVAMGPRTNGSNADCTREP